MRVGVIGAGISGLAAARALHRPGHEVVVFEKSVGVGGRVATRRSGDYIFDTGASSIVPRGLAIETAMLHELSTEKLVRVEKPIFVHSNFRISSGDTVRNAQPRYTYRGGNTTLPKLLAEGLDIRKAQNVEHLERRGRGFGVLDEDFDCLILTMPIPQATQLLFTIGDSRPFANSNYRSCLSVLLGYDKSLTPVPSWHAILEPEGRGPLSWLCVENLKCADRAPEGHTALVAQLSGSFSFTHYDDSDESIFDWTMDNLARVLGPGWENPKVRDLKRWKYSQPEGLASFESVNRPGSKIVIAGDGLTGGRVEQAYEAGVKAALLLVAQES